MSDDKLYPPKITDHYGRRHSRYRISLADWYKRPDDLTDCDVYYYSLFNAEDGIEPWILLDGIDYSVELKPDGIPQQFQLDKDGIAFRLRYATDYVYISEPDYLKLCAHLNGVK